MAINAISGPVSNGLPLIEAESSQALFMLLTG